MYKNRWWDEVENDVKKVKYQNMRREGGRCWIEEDGKVSISKRVTGNK